MLKHTALGPSRVDQRPLKLRCMAGYLVDRRRWSTIFVQRWRDVAVLGGWTEVLFAADYGAVDILKPRQVFFELGGRHWRRLVLSLF